MNLPARHRVAAEVSEAVEPAVFSEAASERLVWIQAPAGFGKSECLRRLYTASIAPEVLPVWINCEFGDGAGELIALLFHLDGSAVAQELAYATQQQWRPESGLEGLLQNWCALLEQCSLSVVIAVDDADMLDAEAMALLCQLVLQCPPTITLRIAARQLPMMASRAVSGSGMYVVGPQRLLWTVEATSQWLQRQGMDLKEEQRQLLESRFHGWPAALRIWSVCFRAAGHHAMVPPGLANFELQDFWCTDVLAGVSKAQRRLLQQAAVLGPVYEGLLSCVNECDTADDIKALIRLGLLVAKDRLGWAQLLPCFVETAASMVSEQDREIWHQRAFDWYDKHNQPVQALEHGQKGRINGGLTVWVENRAEALLGTLDIGGLVDWCDLVGDVVLRQSPRLMQLACWAWMLTYRLRRAESLLRYLAQNRLLEAAELKALQGYMARLKGHNKSALKLCSEALNELDGDRYSLRFLMCSSLTYLALGETDLNEARAWNRQAVGVSRQHGSLTLESLALFDQARIELHRGHLDFSKTLVDGGVQRLQSMPEHLAAMPMGRLLLYRAFLLWLTGDDRSQLLSLLEQGISHCCKSGDVLVTYGYGLKAMELAAAGQSGMALDSLDEAERLMQRWGVDTDVYLWLMLVKANIWIFQDKYQRAEEAIDQVSGGRDVAHLARPEIFPMLPDFVAATRARLYLLCGRYDDCLQEVDEWLRCNSSPMIKLLIQLMRAAALRGKNRIAESQHLFSQLAHHMRNEGLSLSLRAWLPELYSPSDAVSVTGSPAQRVQLSDREHDVLRKIAEGASNQDIASQLFISIHTVKSHARKINMKLGVKNRTQAIRKAKELLLL